MLILIQCHAFKNCIVGLQKGLNLHLYLCMALSDLKFVKKNYATTVFEANNFAKSAYFATKVRRSHSQMLGKVESGGGPIFKVVLEC